MRKVFALVTGTLAAAVLMIVPVTGASAAGFGSGGGATVACGFCDVGF